MRLASGGLLLGLATRSIGASLVVQDSLRDGSSGFGTESFERVSHAAFPDHTLRLKSPKICDPTVKQYSGYLDVSEDKHIFFWFFEARNKPKKAPTAIWLNGGPGCSSSTGLFFALGPCSIGEDGKDTTVNKYSWNNNANMLFIDQPAGVGYSYNNGTPVENSFIAAEDMWALLQLFYKRFGHYSRELHIAGESYGGTYIPHMASAIYKNNKALAKDLNMGNDLQHINLTSILIGNGFTEPYHQFGVLYEWYCDGKWKVLDKDGPECRELKGSIATCQRLINSCYDFDSQITCGAASIFCFATVFGAIDVTGLNPNDARRKCEAKEEGESCYLAESWISIYLNKPEVKKELGVSDEYKFTKCNADVQRAFIASGDPARGSASLLPELIEDGLRMLIYVGDADLLCPGTGQIIWLENLNTTYQKRFVDSPRLDFRTNNRTAGFTKSSGGKHDAGEITYVEIYEAGHMAPHDQPDAALDMFNRWIENKPLDGGD